MQGDEKRKKENQEKMVALEGKPATMATKMNVMYFDGTSESRVNYVVDYLYVLGSFY